MKTQSAMHALTYLLIHLRGGRVTSAQLHRDYLDWVAENGAPTHASLVIWMAQHKLEMDLANAMWRALEASDTGRYAMADDAA